MSWSADLYLQFETERARPIRDLIATIPAMPAQAVTDLGCGPGTSTEALAQTYPAARIHGIDTAPGMIEAARQRCPALRFSLQDIGTWSPDTPQDIILANASLQWVPNHRELFPRLARHLAPAGTLAIQMPDNLNEPSHALMREVAATGPWAGQLAQAASARTEILEPLAYYALLFPICARIDIWRTTYHLVLPGHAAIADFYRSTGLRPYLAPLGEAERADFIAAYTTALAGPYPALPEGTVLLPSPRLFIVAIARG
jgi:trans-aconitate 2-methyltransferase